ncbi:maestro heat-like repeat-containing protein family member 2A [Trichosurus vulpecula]|uniref:maestro heat-like repeat-containing protein family member 2A n=1 Tax=Trichosurus vulpecula TaxID=9337 RepID=UPI00186B005E|nr:maestro heat-like repeat-containing protein family member 2A [Trichosurus vulpecula]
MEDGPIGIGSPFSAGGPGLQGEGAKEAWLLSAFGRKQPPPWNSETGGRGVEVEVRGSYQPASGFLLEGSPEDDPEAQRGPGIDMRSRGCSVPGFGPHFYHWLKASLSPDIVRVPGEYPGCLPHPGYVITGPKVGLRGWGAADAFKENQLGDVWSDPPKGLGPPDLDKWQFDAGSGPGDSGYETATSHFYQGHFNALGNKAREQKHFRLFTLRKAAQVMFLKLLPQAVDATIIPIPPLSKLRQMRLQKSYSRVKMRVSAQRCRKCSMVLFEELRFSQEGTERVLGGGSGGADSAECYGESVSLGAAQEEPFREALLDGPHDAENCEGPRSLLVSKGFQHLELTLLPDSLQGLSCPSQAAAGGAREQAGPGWEEVLAGHPGKWPERCWRGEASPKLVWSEEEDGGGMEKKALVPARLSISNPTLASELPGPSGPSGGVFQQVTNLLNIVDEDDQESNSLSSQEGHGSKMRKALASMIIIQKANAEPSEVMTALIHSLQLEEISIKRKVSIYTILQGIIQQEGELDEECVQTLVNLASREMREIQEIEGYLLAETASDTLVALSRNHFNLVMYELQHHLKPLILTDEFVLITLANLANANVFEFMPYMGITLATIFTMLRLANGAKMRQVFCSAMETFCEAIQFYLKHWEDSVYPIMTGEHFMNKLLPMYRHFVTVWLRSENTEVKLAVIKSLRPMLNLLLPIEELREQVYDYIPLLLAEYQGSVEALFITQILRQILEVSVSSNTPVPKMQLHTIFTELHIQVCSKAPALQQFSSENLAEVVQCFIALARSYPDELMKFFRNQMQTGKEAIRVGTLTLLRAVLSADVAELNSRTLHLAVKVVRNALCDPRAKVKLAILRVIGQLAISGYQERVRGWGLRYVSLQLILSTYRLMNRQESCSQADLEEKMVHKVTMDTVRIITASVSGVINEFWLKLLGYIMETEYTEALTPICISLTNLAERQRQEKESNTNVGWRGQVELPAPQKLLARLLVLLSAPYKGEGRGVAMLQLLKTLHQNIAPAMADLWEVEIPALIQYLEEHTQYTWNQKTWEDKLIQFLRNSLKRTQGTTWSLRLSRELNHQIVSYESPSVEKAFLYRALGFTLAAGQEADKVEIQLMELLHKTDYGNDFDREGAILCLGLCARGQVVTVLHVLQEFEEKIQETEDSWHISAWRSDHPWRREVVKSALMVMYSSVAAHCHPRMLLSCVEKDITKKILHHYATSCQDVSLKLAFVQSISQICLAIQALGKVDFDYTYKPELTTNLMAILKMEPLDSLVSPVRCLTMTALWHLSKLRPPFTLEENHELMDRSIQCVFPLPPPGEDSEQVKTLYENSMSALMRLMQSLLEREMDPKGLQETFHLLVKWLHSEKDWERERAVMLSLHLLQVYREGVTILIPLKSGQFGTLIGLLAPHTCDSQVRTRQSTIDVICCLLDLQGKETRNQWDTVTEKLLLDIKDELKTTNMEKIYSLSSKIAKVISKEVRWEELVILLQSTCESLGATNLTHDKAAVTWLNTILRLRSHELEDKVPEILSTILAHLPLVLHPDVRRPLVEAVLLLAHSYQEPVITSLLRQPLPLDSNITELWEALAEDSAFARKILQALMARIQAKKAPRSSPASKKDIWRLAAVDPITAVCALHKITMALDSGEKLQDIFPELSCTVLQELSSSTGPWQTSLTPDTWGVIRTGNLQNKITPRSPNCILLLLNTPQGLSTASRSKLPPASWLSREQDAPSLLWAFSLASPRLTIKTLQGVLSRAGSEEMMYSLVDQGVWTLLEDPRTHIDGMCLLARTMILHISAYSQRFAQLLLPGLDSEFLPWRLSSTAFFIELMCDPVLYRKKMLKSTVLKLAKGASHVHSTLRLLSIRALGNLAIGAPSKVKHYRKLLLKKFLCSLSDPLSTQVISETMVALTKVLGLMAEEDLGSSFEVISMQCRAFFDDENEMLRLQAIILFGKLAIWVGKKRDFFTMEVRKSWIPLILHLQDPCPEVAKACETTICLCIPFWGWRRLQMTLEKFVNQGTDLSLFQMEMCSYLARKDPALLDTFCAEAIGYYDSEWAKIKAAACTFTGYVLEQVVPQNLGEMDLERLHQCLQALQMDSEPIVQSAAKETISLLRGRELEKSGNMPASLVEMPVPLES